MTLPNHRHERFAQALAKGHTATEAYRLAGYKGDRTAASRLSTKVNIADRVSELQGKAAKRVEVTVETLAAELEEARQRAIANDQPSAAVSATMGKAKLFGLLVEKRHVTGAIGTYDLTRVSDDDLARLEEILGPLADAGGDQGGEEA